MKIKPKTYGPLVAVSPSPDSICITTEAGHQVTGALSPQAQGMSPSDLLLASVASCILISMRMAAQQMGLQLGDLTVTAHATKALDAPNRFAQLDVDAHTTVALDSDVVPRLVERTKSLCTVSNTLSAGVSLSLTAGQLA